MHTVEAGQTLYAIANLYGLEVEQLEAWNPTAAQGLSIGDVLVVGAAPNQPTRIPRRTRRCVPIAPCFAARHAARPADVAIHVGSGYGGRRRLQRQDEPPARDLLGVHARCAMGCTITE